MKRGQLYAQDIKIVQSRDKGYQNDNYFLVAADSTGKVRAFINGKESPFIGMPSHMAPSDLVSARRALLRSRFIDDTYRIDVRVAALPRLLNCSEFSNSCQFFLTYWMKGSSGLFLTLSTVHYF